MYDKKISCIHMGVALFKYIAKKYIAKTSFAILCNLWHHYISGPAVVIEATYVPHVLTCVKQKHILFGQLCQSKINLYTQSLIPQFRQQQGQK